MLREGSRLENALFVKGSFSVVSLGKACSRRGMSHNENAHKTPVLLIAWLDSQWLTIMVMGTI